MTHTATQHLSDIRPETQGYVAFQLGMELSDCPHPEHSKESHDWIKGWATAGEEARQGWADKCNPAVAAVEFALKEGSAGGIEFLRAWNEGDFKAIREEWPEAPKTVFIGDDPLL